MQRGNGCVLAWCFSPAWMQYSSSMEMIGGQYVEAIFELF